MPSYMEKPDLFDDEEYSSSNSFQQGQAPFFSFSEVFYPNTHHSFDSSDESKKGYSYPPVMSSDLSHQGREQGMDFSNQSYQVTPGAYHYPIYHASSRSNVESVEISNPQQVDLFDEEENPFQSLFNDYSSQNSVQAYSNSRYPQPSFSQSIGRNAFDREPSDRSVNRQTSEKQYEEAAEPEDPLIESTTDKAVPSALPVQPHVPKREIVKDSERRRKRNSAYRITGLILCVSAILFIAIFLTNLLNELHRNEFDGKQLEEQILQNKQAASVSVAVTSPPKTVFAFPENEVYSATERYTVSRYADNPMADLLPEILEYRQTYPEALGRITIDGIMDEPFFQSNGLYYLTHDSFGNTTDNGSVYVNSEVKFELKPPEHIILHGLSSQNTGSLACLQSFMTGGESFAHTCRMATLLTPCAQESYVLFAVFQSNSASPDAFQADQRVHFASDRTMMDYVAEARQRSLYSFDIPVEPEDRLLTVSTVSQDGISIVLVYRALRTGEIL